MPRPGLPPSSPAGSPSARSAGGLPSALRAGDARDVEIVYGLRAGLALFARRPDDVVWIAHTRGCRNAITELVRWATSHRLACEQVSEGELTRVAGTAHHEGLVLGTRPRRWMRPADLAALLVRTQGIAIAFDRVRNPYNVGAILRTAAFFGLEAALLGAPAPHPGLAPEAVRVAEGGAEHLAIARTTDLADTLGRLRARGMRVIAAENDGTAPLFGFVFPRPAVIVVGHEREGISTRVRAQCDTTLTIPGCGGIGSLNVAIAASLVIAEAVRNARRS